jgi:aminoglycoside phosphotransferase (APT) family kinase protein
VVSEVTHPVRLTADELPERLEKVIRQRLPGAEHATIVNWAPTDRGYSTETFTFDVTGMRTTEKLVFRRPPEHAILPDYDLRRQYLTMQRLRGSAVPVPQVRWIDCEGDDLGTPYFVMDRIEDTVGVSDVPSYHESGIYADADEAGRATLWNGCVDMIAAVHQVDPAAHRLGFLRPPGTLASFLRYALTWAADGRPLQPGLVRGLDWLDAHPYTPDRVTLCWGDARMSNVLYRPDHTPKAVLDWEIAYLGDPAGDVAWLLSTDWISSPLPGRAPAPGTPSRDETIGRYQERTGHRLTNLRYSDVTAPLLLAVALIRLTGNLGLADFDLSEICAQRVDFVLDGD